jgi:hypothetical protein
VRTEQAQALAPCDVFPLANHGNLLEVAVHQIADLNELGLIYLGDALNQLALLYQYGGGQTHRKYLLAALSGLSRFFLTERDDRPLKEVNCYRCDAPLKPRDSN